MALEMYRCHLVFLKASKEICNCLKETLLKGHLLRISTAGVTLPKTEIGPVAWEKGWIWSRPKHSRTRGTHW